MLSMKPIQLVLIALILVIALLAATAFRNRLVYRLFVLAGVVVAIIFTIYPDLTSALAQILGVGRGVDLVFYLLFMVGAYALVALYRRILKLDETITAINRRDALRSAEKLGKEDRTSGKL